MKKITTNQYVSTSKSILSVTSIFWREKNGLTNKIIALTIVILSILGVVTALSVNEWYKHFYNAVQASDERSVYALILCFLCITGLSTIRSVLIAYLIDILALRWRAWLTMHFLDRWAASPTSIENIILLGDNPDQRITEDIKNFTYETLDLACGLIYTIVSAASFGILLITTSGDLLIWGFTIPCYMFWAALTYALLGTIASQNIGEKLVKLSNIQQTTEADLRYEAIKLRELLQQSTSIKIRLARKFKILNKFHITLNNLRTKIKLKMKLACFTESYSGLSLIISTLLALPRFFTKEITFGELMQINSTFANLYENLSWCISIYPRLAEWKATVDRISYLDLALKSAEQSEA